MTAGGAQTMLKASGLVPDGRVVLAGSGPLLYLLAAQFVAAGASISALLDTTPSANRGKALPHLPAFLASPYLRKGLALLWKTRRSLRIMRGVSTISAEGDGKLASVRFSKGGATETLACDLLLLHQGVVPNINLSNAAGCAQDWDETQLCFTPRLDAWLESSVPGIASAGDGAGIAGAESAALRGTLAALGAAFRLGRLDEAARDGSAGPVRAELARMARGRAFLDHLYQPAKALRIPPEDNTIVCRCEEVTAGMIRTAVAHGVTGPNQMKSFLRCGMGPCQSRQCGLTVTEMIAEARGLPPAEIGALRLRPPVKPITLAELASLPKTEAATRAVVR
jgi:NADPH-dependent 2,4-dienoyl-CoA reductase/sulfur reductase-like enzyme